MSETAKAKIAEFKSRLAGKTQTAEIENPRTGEKATVETDRSVPPKGKVTVKSKQPKVAYDSEAHKKLHKAIESEPPKKTKIPFTTNEKATLKDIEQKVLDFLNTLDHPATSNEVRDKFGFKLRADARRIFKKLANLGYGENRKVGNKYLFFVKGKDYPPPKVEPPKAEEKGGEPEGTK